MSGDKYGREFTPLYPAALVFCPPSCKTVLMQESLNSDVLQAHNGYIAEYMLNNQQVTLLLIRLCTSSIKDESTARDRHQGQVASIVARAESNTTDSSQSEKKDCGEGCEEQTTTEGWRWWGI